MKQRVPLHSIQDYPQIISILLIGGFTLCSFPSNAAGGTSDLPVNVPKKLESATVLSSRQFTKRVNPALEAAIVNEFSDQRCDKVRALSKGADPSLFYPSVLAVIAYCTTEKGTAESLFKMAEAKSSDNETVCLLHAHYRWQTDPKSAEVLWQRVIFIARNRAIKGLAQEYLDGNVESKDQITLNQPWSYFGNMSLSSGHESNPESAGLSEQRIGSASYGVELATSVQKLTSYGNATASYSLLNTRYPSEKSSDIFSHNFEFPLTIRADSRNDFVFRPFLNYTTLGNVAYQGAAGFALMGVAFRGDIKQTIQGSVFRDRYFQGLYSAEAGSHLRFEYDWELFRAFWYLNFRFSVEHTLADADTVPDDNTNDTTTAVITYSHTDLAFQANIDHDFKLLSIGLFPKLLLREDSDPSTYASTSGKIVSKRRQDFQIALQPNITIPLDVGMQLFFWYEWSRTYSNLGATDYQDKNVLNQIVGLSFKTYFNSY